MFVRFPPEHIEATAYNGIGLIRVYLQPGRTSIRQSRRSWH